MYLVKCCKCGSLYDYNNGSYNSLSFPDGFSFKELPTNNKFRTYCDTCDTNQYLTPIIRGVSDIFGIGLNILTMQTKENLKTFINFLYTKYNLNFHPDDEFVSYCNFDGPEPPIFTPDQCVYFDWLISEAFKKGFDVYGITQSELAKYKLDSLLVQLDIDNTIDSNNLWVELTAIRNLLD